MRHIKVLGGSAAALAVVIAAFGVQAGFGAGPSAPSSVVTIDPARILDTRIALGVPGTTPVGPTSTITVQVTGVGGVPANATGVVVTITGTQATQATFVTATPTGTPRSTTSVLNVSAGVDIANTVTMALGTNGQIDLFNNGGTVHLVADVTGYLLPETGGGATTTTTTNPIPTVVEEVLEITPLQGARIDALNPDPSTGCVNLGAAGNVYLDVPIPTDSSIKHVDWRYYDNEAMNNQTFLLYEVDQLAPTQAPTANMTLSGNQISTNALTGYNTLRMTPTGADRVSDKIHYYMVAFTTGAVAGQQWFCGASVTYQYIES